MEELDQRSQVVAARLRSLGALPVDDTTVRRHLAAMERVRLAPEAPEVPQALRVRFRRVRVGAATVVAGLLGVSGLAVAGALPDPAQDLASDALGVIGLNVPRGTEDCNNDLEVAEPVTSAGDCDDASGSSD